MKEDEKYVLFIDVVRSTYRLKEKKEIRLKAEGENKKIYFRTEEEVYAFLKKNYGEELLKFEETIKEGRRGASNFFSIEVAFNTEENLTKEGEIISRIEEIHSIYLEKNEEN